MGGENVFRGLGLLEEIFHAINEGILFFLMFLGGIGFLVVFFMFGLAIVTAVRIVRHRPRYILRKNGKIVYPDPEDLKAWRADTARRKVRDEIVWQKDLKKPGFFPGLESGIFFWKIFSGAPWIVRKDDVRWTSSNRNLRKLLREGVRRLQGLSGDSWRVRSFSVFVKGRVFGCIVEPSSFLLFTDISPEIFYSVLESGGFRIGAGKAKSISARRLPLASAADLKDALERLERLIRIAAAPESGERLAVAFLVGLPFRERWKLFWKNFRAD